MRKGIGVVVFAGLLLAALPAQSTVLLYLDIAQLAQKSSVILQGKVVGQRVIRGKEYIWTDSYVKVEETHKGKLPSNKVVVLRSLGGETPTVGMKVAGMARFKVGEQVLVFARSVGGLLLVPTGACLGKFTVYKTAQGKRVRRDFTGASFGRFDPNGKFRLEESLSTADAGDMPLSRLVKKISAAQARGGAR